MEFKENCYSHFFFSIHELPRREIGLTNLSIHKYSYSERQIHSKRLLKKSLSIDLKENHLSHFFSRERLLEPKNGLPNLVFHQFFL